MKHILVVSGSPRPTGNTYKVTKLIEDRMKQSDEAEFDYLFLKKANLEYCRGCLLCMKKGEETCPCKDDAIMLRDKMLAADGIIFISPVYVHTVTALIKNFYDRFAYMCHQPHFRDKAAMMVVTTELSGGEETLEYMKFPAFTWGFRLSASLDVVYPSFVSEGDYREKVMRRIDEAAKAFHRDLTTPRGKPTFRELAFFNLLKTKIKLHKDMLPHDYRFWEERGWLNRRFYDEENIPGIKSRLARFLVKMRVRKMAKEYGLKLAPASAN
jgi:multimeric flavodoxin WrbA